MVVNKNSILIRYICVTIRLKWLERKLYIKIVCCSTKVVLWRLITTLLEWTLVENSCTSLLQVCASRRKEVFKGSVVPLIEFAELIKANLSAHIAFSETAFAFTTLNLSSKSKPSNHHYIKVYMVFIVKLTVEWDWNIIQTIEFQSSLYLALLPNFGFLSNLNTRYKILTCCIDYVQQTRIESSWYNCPAAVNITVIIILCCLSDMLPFTMLSECDMLIKSHFCREHVNLWYLYWQYVVLPFLSKMNIILQLAI